MFEVNDYVYYGTDGICQIDEIKTEPFENAPKGVLYYVLHTLGEPRQTIWNPVENTRIPMRHIMRKEEIGPLLASLSSLPTLQGENAKQMREAYLQAIKSGEPRAWCQVIRTYHTRQKGAKAKLLRVTDAERNFYESAKRLLLSEIALVTDSTPKQVEERLKDLFF